MIDLVSNSWSAVTRVHHTGVVTAHTTVRPSAPNDAVQSLQSDSAAAQKASEAAKQELSSFVLQGFLNAALPKDLVGSEGTGTAGAMWRSLFAQELSKVLVQSGQIDLLGEKPSVSTASTVSAGLDQWKAVIK